ncbi:MAG: tetratricopeptide repeat protein [Betaproteobacteria bacterium]|nr:MAG: tetratricopeptide repeat protein [Betaproteobacteria bacterium]
MDRANIIADALIAEGNKAENSGKLREACEQYRRAVVAAPGYARAHLNLGIGLEAAGDVDAAIRSYEAALAIDPRDPYANYNLGKVLCQRRELGRAEPLIRTALDCKPEFPEAQVVLSNLYESRGDLAAAESALESALKQRPDWAGVLFNYAGVLWKLDRLSEAETALRRAIAIDPGLVPAYGLLGLVLRGLARIPEAVEVLGAARKLDPERFDIESTLLFMLTCWDEISSDALFASHKDFGARLESVVARRFEPFGNSRDPERRLRVGYVSGDFYSHPVSLFAIPLFERHDRSTCEVFCYSTGAKADEVTEKVRARADVWRDVASMSDTGLAETINRDGIDILVDLSGHSGTFRIVVFAQQPAPVQVTWLGYLNTTGLTRIQYRLCDRHTDPPGVTDRFHTETLVRLPRSQWCYRQMVSIDCAEAPPFARNGFITFGSFNNALKLSQSTRRLWAEILTRLPDSRLVFAGIPKGPVRDGLIRAFERAGIAADRLAIFPRLALPEYHRLFNTVDLALDATPYSGGTTTCDTLWMGVPVITLRGTRSVSRSAASILATVGLSDWIAESPEDYVRLAVKYAGDRAVITELRQTLRERMRASPLMDELQFARDVEDAYRRMWRAWCGSEAR